MSEDDELFMQEFADVQRLAKGPSQYLKKPGESELAAQRRREAAVAEPDQGPLLPVHEIEMLDAWMPLEFKRPGVQHGVFRRLKQGRYPWDARLDLHRMTVERAATEVEGFVNEALASGLRSVLIVHGKAKAQAGGARLKSYLNFWLPKLEPVQAYCSAQPQHGGTGAVYVLLKKSEQQRQQTRDRLQQRRGS